MTPTKAPAKVFETPWFTIDAVPDPAAGPEPYYRLSCHDSVEVLAVTPDKKLILVRQFRPAVGVSMLELPSGHIDAGETAKEAAARELREETGYSCESLVHLGSFRVAPSRINNRLDVFFGKAKKLPAGSKREEGIDVVLASQARFHQLIKRGEFITVSGIGFYYVAKLRGLL